MACTGAGLRAWGLAEGLRGRGLDVEIAMASDAMTLVPPDLRERVAPFLFDRSHLTDHVCSRKPDTVVMQHWGLMDQLGEVDCPLVIDLAGPHLLERRAWGSATPERDLEQKLNALARADFLTCSGHRQRAYFLAFALQCGFDPTDPDLLPVIPFSVSPELPPEPEDRDDNTFAYAGFFLPWQDPSLAIGAALDAMEQREKGQLRFIGGAHPAGDMAHGAFDRILERLNTSPHASLEEPRPFDTLVQDLTRCGVALDLMAKNPERELAFPSRTVVYLSCGLPVITNDYDELSAWIGQYEAGWRLDPTDGGAVARLVEELMRDPAQVRERRQNARRLVRERLTWDRTVGPLADWCAAPSRRPNKTAPTHTPNDSRVEHLEHALDEMSGRRLVRLSNWLRRIGPHR
jgi:glycosyltransferase involved in cell wall biosynthesis